MGRITEYFVKLGIQNQQGGARKASLTLNVYTKMSWLNVVLQFLQIYSIDFELR